LDDVSDILLLLPRLLNGCGNTCYVAQVTSISILDFFRLQNQKIAVLGGNGLLGKVVRNTVTELGGEVISIDRVYSGENTYTCDITEPYQLGKIAGYHDYNGVINCAIGNQYAGAEPITSRFHRDIDVGLLGAANAHECFYEPLKKTAGVFLNIGSDLSLKPPDPNRYGKQFKPLSYSIIKYGIVGMTKYYAALWGRDQIRVNCLCPGGIEQGQAVPQCALGRLAKPHEMAGAIAWLISEASSYVTGAVISVDGGSTL